MTNNEPDVLVRRLIDRELSDDQVKQALHRIAEDEEARSVLQFELRMTQELASSRSARPSEDFADHTMQAIASEPTPSEQGASLREQLRTTWDAMTGSVEVRVRPLSAVVVTILLGIVGLTFWPASEPDPLTQARSSSTSATNTQTVQQTSARSSSQATVWIRFMYTNSDADSVAVAGDFSQWDPVSLSPREVNEETVWTGLVPVSRGEHEYQFLINGERWVTDPLAPVKRSDGFGAKNAVLNI